MTKLKLGPIADDRPVKVTVELPASLHRDLKTYADVLGQRFIETDRGFAKARRNAHLDP